MISVGMSRYPMQQYKINLKDCTLRVPMMWTMMPRFFGTIVPSKMIPRLTSRALFLLRLHRQKLLSIQTKVSFGRIQTETKLKMSIPGAGHWSSVEYAKSQTSRLINYEI